MAVDLQEIKDSVASYLGGGGSFFDDAFLRACKRVTADINRDCFQTLDLPQTVTYSVPVDEARYYKVYDDGVMYYMQLSGEWVRERNIPEALQRYRRSMALAQYEQIQENEPESGYPARS
jgi:hypothetical protein